MTALILSVYACNGLATIKQIEVLCKHKSYDGAYQAIRRGIKSGIVFLDSEKMVRFTDKGRVELFNRYKAAGLMVIVDTTAKENK